MNEFGKMRNGYFYNCTDKELSAIHTKALRFCEKYNKVSILRYKKRTKMISSFFAKSGKNPCVLSSFNAEYGKNITVGDNFFSNFNCVMLDVAKIDIGNNVMIGTNVSLVTPMHPLLAEERVVQNYPSGTFDLEYSKPIKIGNNVWISSGATVCGGVTIGDNSVISAGSAVVKDVPSGVLVGGVPAKIIRPITEADKMNVWQSYVDGTMPMSEHYRAKLNK